MVVSPGIYAEHVVMPNKAVTLTTSNPFDSSVAERTIIDGGGTGVPVLFEGCNAATKIIGFTIRNGYGAGIQVQGSSNVTIHSNVITGTQTNWQGMFGAGVLMRHASTCAVRQNAIVNNPSQDGGILIDALSDPVVDLNTITGNQGYESGGIKVRGQSIPTIANNQISLNSSMSWGGGIHSVSSAPTIFGNLIGMNSSQREGGGIAIDGNTVGHVTIRDNTIRDNIGGSGGGGVYFNNARDVMLTGNQILNNTTPRKGGGISVLIYSEILNESGAKWPRIDDADATNTYGTGNTPGNVHFESWDEMPG